MNITIFTDTFLPGTDGVVVSILNSTRILSKKGHKFLIIAPKYGNYVEQKYNKNIRIVRIPSISAPTYKDFKMVLPYYRKCLAEVTSFNPDIVHIETFSSLGVIGARIANKLKLPLIGTYHTIAAEFTHYLLPKRISELNIIKSKPWDSPLKRIIWDLTLKLYNRCDVVISPSNSIKKELVRRGMKKKVVVISNGIDTSLFKSKDKYMDSVTRLIHVGRISYEKKVDETIKAFSLVDKKYRKDIIYEIIGSGPALNHLKIVAKQYGVSKYVKFSGYIAHEKLPKIYKNADVFLTASPMETQGLVILEAMASGLPVIGVNAYAVPDVVKNGFNGFVTEKNNAEDMAAKIEVLVKNPGLVKKFGKNSAMIAKRHDLLKVTDVLEKTYKRLCN